MAHVNCRRDIAGRNSSGSITRVVGVGLFLTFASGGLSGAARAADPAPGLQISAGATAVMQGIVGPASAIVPGARDLHAPYSVDVGFAMPVHANGAAGLVLETGRGNGLDSDLASYSGLNADAVNEPAVQVRELWWEQTAGSLRLRGGMIDVTADLDVNAYANSETEQFLSPGFVNNLAVEFPAANGPGLVVAVTPGAGLELTLAAAEADADWTHVLNRPFLAAQLSHSTAIHGRDGSRRIYLWRNSLPHQDLRCDDRGNEPGYGFGLSFDQSLAGPVGAFGRMAQERGAVYPLGVSWSAGMQVTLPPLGPIGQTIGAAIGRNHSASPWARLYKTATDGTTCSDELHYEVYDNFRVHEHLSVTVDLQRLDNPDGDSAVREVWVPGLRLQLSH
jgi:hypothetical protein